MSDSDDEDLKAAIALSLADARRDEDDVQISEATPATASSTSSMQASSGLAGLDRKAMEAERLARMAARNGGAGLKRDRAISPPPLLRPSKVARMSESGNISASAAQTTSTQQPLGSSTLKYPHGKLLKTWAFGHNRDGREIKIEEVLEKATLETALVSSFQYDLEWLFTKFTTQKTKFHFVVHENKMPANKVKSGPSGSRNPETTQQRSSLVEDLQSLGANVKAYAPTEGRCMHSKLMLLVHPHKLRVAIPSANLVPYDWGEDGIMENTVWLIDLPRKNTNDTDAEPESIPFLDEVKFFLGKQRLPLSVVMGLNKFDWSATRPYAFVHTVAGHSYGSDLARTGLTGLSSAIRGLGLACKHAQVDMCASSVGALTEAQVSSLHAAACGDLQAMVSNGKATTLPQPTSTHRSSAFRLFFPTYDYVASSPRGGVGNGGTIWFSKEYYQRQDFPKDIFRQYHSTRSQLLSHCKIMFVRGFAETAAPEKSNGFNSASALFGKKSDKKQDVAGEPVAYMYAGSANCSKSAWGNVIIDKTTGSAHRGEAKIFCENWECGVLIPVLGPGVKERTTNARYGAGQRLSGDEGSTAVEDKDVSTAENNEPYDDDETESEDDDETSKKGKITSKLPDFSIFKSVIDGPFKYPAEKLGNKEPWYVKEHHPAYKRPSVSG
ncbi:Hypothetical protein D9617_16g014090 [Elsinoe fawcettii]|nr:Hypothetical protein D9617_16g014090 [Elsinoe fawcettii]